MLEKLAPRSRSKLPYLRLHHLSYLQIFCLDLHHIHLYSRGYFFNESGCRLQYLHFFDQLTIHSPLYLSLLQNIDFMVSQVIWFNCLTFPIGTFIAIPGWRKSDIEYFFPTGIKSRSSSHTLKKYFQKRTFHLCLIYLDFTF